jgi:hypothetical protein
MIDLKNMYFSRRAQLVWSWIVAKVQGSAQNDLACVANPTEWHGMAARHRGKNHV